MLAAEILQEAADACHADMKDVRAGRRFHNVVRARRAAIYAMRKWTDKPHSYSHIGRLYGTDHKSARYHFDMAETARERDPHFRSLTDSLVLHARDVVEKHRVGQRPGVKPLHAFVPRQLDKTLTKHVRAILALAADLLDADLDEMLRKLHREGPEFEASAAAVWALRRAPEPALSFPQLGKLLARHHSTIIHADKRAEELRAIDPDFAQATETLLAETQRRLS